jgi:cation:H+ antiporter
MKDELAVEVAEFFELTSPRLPRTEAIRTILGMAVMVGAAELLVRSAGGLARRLGLSEGFVGLTIVAVGTSAPLIASSILAARRGDHDLVVGNVLGSNLFISLAGGAIVGLVPGGAAPGVGLAPLIVRGDGRGLGVHGAGQQDHPPGGPGADRRVRRGVAPGRPLSRPAAARDP